MYVDPSGLSDVLTIGEVLVVADGPLLFGDFLAGVLVVGGGIYELGKDVLEWIFGDDEPAYSPPSQAPNVKIQPKYSEKEAILHNMEDNVKVSVEEASKVISQIKKQNPDSTIIFRTGSGNATNLTPRQNDVNGLSYTTIMPTQGKFTITSVEAVNATGKLRAIKDGKTHVSVLPYTPYEMREWMESRENAIVNPHELTITLTNISIKVN